MATPNHSALFSSGIQQVLPLQDRALIWAGSICFHTLALAVASVATMLPRELPHVQNSVTRLEILLTEGEQEAEQATATDSQSQADPTTPQETAAIAEDSSLIVPAPPPPVIQRIAQRSTARTPTPQTAEMSSPVSDPLPAEISRPIEPHSEPPAPASELDPPASQSLTEAIEQAEMATATHSPPEPMAQSLDDHAESLTQQEDVASPQTDPTSPTSMSNAQTDAMGSSPTPSAETAAMNHPAITQSVSTRSQYAWLMELLRRRIITLQAYPRLARTQGWEGVVVVKTTINSDGSLIDAVVTKSSGHDALDEDAVKLMHRVCPVHLTQDLGKSTIAVMIPIRYRLDGFE